MSLKIVKTGTFDFGILGNSLSKKLIVKRYINGWVCELIDTQKKVNKLIIKNSFMFAAIKMEELKEITFSSKGHIYIDEFITPKLDTINILDNENQEISLKKCNTVKNINITYNNKVFNYNIPDGYYLETFCNNEYNNHGNYKDYTIVYKNEFETVRQVVSVDYINNKIELLDKQYNLDSIIKDIIIDSSAIIPDKYYSIHLKEVDKSIKKIVVNKNVSYVEFGDSLDSIDEIEFKSLPHFIPPINISPKKIKFSVDGKELDIIVKSKCEIYNHDNCLMINNTSEFETENIYILGSLEFYKKYHLNKLTKDMISNNTIHIPKKYDSFDIQCNTDNVTIDLSEFIDKDIKGKFLLEDFKKNNDVGNGNINLVLPNNNLSGKIEIEFAHFYNRLNKIIINDEKTNVLDNENFELNFNFTNEYIEKLEKVDNNYLIRTNEACILITPSHEVIRKTFDISKNILDSGESIIEDIESSNINNITKNLLDNLSEYNLSEIEKYKIIKKVVDDIDNWGKSINLKDISKSLKFKIDNIK